MAYRNGTYVAFHAEGTPDPTASDIKYFNIMKAWHENDDVNFRFVNSHEKVAAVRDGSLKETLRRSLAERMRNSKNMILIIGQRTRYDTDWVPYEIEYGVDKCDLPIIATYTGYRTIMDPQALSELWPRALAIRIALGSVKAMHVPFQRQAVDAAIRRFDINNPPPSSLEFWSAEAHRSFGIV